MLSARPSPPGPLSREAGEGEKRAAGGQNPSPVYGLYITHKSTYGQRYLPSSPGPLSHTAGEGVNVSAFCALKDTPAMVCERSPVAADTTFG